MKHSMREPRCRRRELLIGQQVGITGLDMGGREPCEAHLSELRQQMEAHGGFIATPSARRYGVTHLRQPLREILRGDRPLVGRLNAALFQLVAGTRELLLHLLPSLAIETLAPSARQCQTRLPATIRPAPDGALALAVLLPALCTTRHVSLHVLFYSRLGVLLPSLGASIRFQGPHRHAA